MALRKKERGREYCIMPMPVKPSMTVYCTASGMTPRV